MRLNAKITFVCALVFALCAACFGVLQTEVCMREARLGAAGKAEAAAISAASMAASDKTFALPERLKLAAERAGLSSLDVSFIDAAKNEELSKRKAANPHTEEMSGFKFSSEYRIPSPAVWARAETLSEELSQLYETYPARVALWAVCGALFGLFTGLAVSAVLAAKIADLRAELENDFAKTTASKLEISELADLADTARLLREIDTRRTSRECFEMNSAASKTSVFETVLRRIMPDTRFDECGMRVSCGTAHGKNDGAFFKKLGGGRILYGRVQAKCGKIRKLADSVAARDISAEYLLSMSPWEAFSRASRFYDFSNWNVVDYSGSDVVRCGLEFDEWKEERSPKTHPCLFSTAELGAAMRFYSRMDMHTDRFEAIMKLAPEDEGGLFVEIEKAK